MQYGPRMSICVCVAPLQIEPNHRILAEHWGDLNCVIGIVCIDYRTLLVVLAVSLYHMVDPYGPKRKIQGFF